MCRRNLLHGSAILAFGVGLLIGSWMNSGFLACICGIAAIFIGFSLLHRK